MEGICMAGTPPSKGKRPLRALSASDKIEAIQRVNDGESKASVARQIGVPESTLRGWCKNEDKLRYMSSRHSTPDTDKSSDGMMDTGIPEKRTKYDLNSVPVNYSQSNVTQYNGTIDMSDGQAMDRVGLDLSRLKDSTDRETKSGDGLVTDFSQFSKSSLELGKSISDLSKVNGDVTSGAPKESKLKNDSGAKISMSAISPLSNLNHLSGLSGLSQNHLGMSFNEIATNLSLIAQLNPSLNSLANSINSSAKMLRSIRSPKPGHSSGSSSGLNSTDKHKSDRKSHNHLETYSDKVRTRSSHSSYKEQPVDDALWYWFKKQQAMLNLANTSTSQLPFSHSISSSRSNKDPLTRTSSSMSNISPVIPPLDKNSWFWQYYKQFTGNLNLQDDKNKIPLKTDSYDNILYSHLTKEKMDDIQSQEQEREQEQELNVEDTRVDENVENKSEEVEETAFKERSSPGVTEKSEKDSSKNQVRVRAVLDNLLLLNNNNVSIKEPPILEENEKDSNTENEFSCEVSEALEHGEKFLKWLEACQEPSVTRMQVHQLKGLLNNIKANATRRNHDTNNKDRISRRK
ncbi:protein distal antenna-like isoform X2 [Arctopsyche grandis]|uniref:protein distal antenna-like isoform X2 n=1 Tax=Arctopsyche grandis TaxID=121162 RepID=UPI00406D8117